MKRTSAARCIQETNTWLVDRIKCLRKAMELVIQVSIQSSNAGYIAQQALKVDDIAQERESHG